MKQRGVLHRIKRFLIGTRGFESSSEEEMTNGCRNCELYKMFVDVTRKSILEDMKGIKTQKMQGQASEEQELSTKRSRYRL